VDVDEMDIVNEKLKNVITNLEIAADQLDNEKKLFKVEKYELENEILKL